MAGEARHGTHRAYVIRVMFFTWRTPENRAARLFAHLFQVIAFGTHAALRARPAAGASMPTGNGAWLGGAGLTI
jgi:hypothetical protein